MKVELRYLHLLCADLDMGNVCPACPKVYHIDNLHLYVLNVCIGFYWLNVQVYCTICHTTKLYTMLQYYLSVDSR